MKTAKMVHIPLSGKKDVFSLSGDCICCGGQADGIWIYRHDYKLEHWKKQSRGISGSSTSLEILKDKNGNPKLGHIEFSLPYCAQHMAQSQKLRRYRDTQISISVGLMLATVIAYFTWLAFGWPISIIDDLSFVVKFMLMPVVIFFLSLLVTTIFHMLLNEILPNFSYFADYPLDSNSSGGSGLSLDIKRPNKKEQKDFVMRDLRLDFIRSGYVKYDLQLGFTREDVAEQFLKSYPASRTTNKTS